VKSQRCDLVAGRFIMDLPKARLLLKLQAPHMGLWHCSQIGSCKIRDVYVTILTAE